MNEIKYLENTRIYLRRLEDSDLNHYLSAVSDPYIRRLTGTSAFLTKKDLEDAFNKWNADSSRIDLIICLQKDNQIIGDLAMLDIDHRERKGSFRIAITKQYTGQGYGSEALRLIIEYMFNTLNLRRIAINVFSFNERAMSTYKKLGFKLEGTLREDLFFDGKYHDNHIMGLMKDEYIR
ncbi:GNAT family N-acetyltransferase [Peribacillus kribbensis]|uniref:GNAT family N-acetyltransferase n=1 Tax=Peribacillus kribbensis TaxID=356658 RepID=UPI000423C570|nr:GNAT family protein [Peribacillus kribbensis]